MLHERRRINVYRAPVPAAQKDVPLPVLYLVDGGLGEDFLHIAGLVQVGAGNGTMRPFLLVGIENTERRRDLTGPTDNPEDRKIAPHTGGSAAFRRFLREELMPRIRRDYRPAAETALVGESLGGLFAVETFLLEPDLFDSYIAIDPSLWWNRGRLVADAPALLRSGARAGKRVFLASSADSGGEAAVRALDASLDAATIASLRHVVVHFPGEKHATIFQPAALRAFRDLLAPPGR